MSTPLQKHLLTTDATTLQLIVEDRLEARKKNALREICRIVRACKGQYETLFEEPNIPASDVLGRLGVAASNGLEQIEGVKGSHERLYSSEAKRMGLINAVGMVNLKNSAYPSLADLSAAIHEPTLQKFLNGNVNDDDVTELMSDDRLGSSHFTRMRDIHFRSEQVAKYFEQDLYCAQLHFRNTVVDALRPRITAEQKRNIDGASADGQIETNTLSAMIELCIDLYKNAPMQNKDCESALEQLKLDPADIDSQKYFLLSFSAFAIVEVPPVDAEGSSTEQ